MAMHQQRFCRRLYLRHLVASARTIEPRSRIMSRSIQINLDTGKKSVSRPIPRPSTPAPENFHFRVHVRDPFDASEDRCCRESISSLGDYLLCSSVSSDQTWESSPDPKRAVLTFSISLAMFVPSTSVVCREDAPLDCSIVDGPEGNEEGLY